MMELTEQHFQETIERLHRDQDYPPPTPQILISSAKWMMTHACVFRLEQQKADLQAEVERRTEALEPERLARQFHEVYERLAPKFDYMTRKASAVPWGRVPVNNRNLMLAAAEEISRAALAGDTQR